MTEEQKIKNREASRRWRLANPDKVREHNKRYYEEHKAELAAKRKAKAARDKYNAKQRERYATDPEFRAAVKARMNKWRTSPEGRAKFNQHQREYMREYSKRPDVKAKQRAYAKGYAAGMRRAKAEFMKRLTTRVIHEFTKG